MAGPRSLARRLALQYLFMIDLTGEDGSQSLREFMVEQCDREEARADAQKLVRNVLTHLEEIDDCIKQAATRWDVNRIAAVERNLLRLGVEELRTADVPAAVVINEAVSLAKKFGSKDSGGFVNGVLDQARKHLEASKESTES